MTTPAPNLALSDDAYEEQAVGLRSHGAPLMKGNISSDNVKSSAGLASPSQDDTIYSIQDRSPDLPHSKAHPPDYTSPSAPTKPDESSGLQERLPKTPPDSRNASCTNRGARRRAEKKNEALLGIDTLMASIDATTAQAHDDSVNAAASSTPPGSPSSLRAEIRTSSAIECNSGVGNSGESHPSNFIDEGAVEAKLSIETKLYSEDHHSSPLQTRRNDNCPVCPSPSCSDVSNDHEGNFLRDSGRDEDVGHTTANLSPSQRSPQSDSENSSEVSLKLLTKDERKIFLLDRLMDYFFQLFSSCDSPVPIFQVRTGPSDTDRNGEGGNFERPSNTSNDTKESSDATDRSAGACRKRGFEREDDDDGDDDDGRDRGRPIKRARVDGGKRNASRKLACPYFKKDPEYARLARSCSGPGWDTVHRLKEHLDRNHALLPSCDRCYTAFKTDADRAAHLRSEIQCQLRDRPSRIQGFDVSQRDQLKSRPRGYKQMSEVQKWCHIYSILFPETDKASIPSPYYNYGSFSDPGHPVDLMVEYDRFLRREMPDRVRRQLEIHIENALNPVEETLRGQIIEIVHEVQSELSQSFRTSIGTTVHNSYSYPEPVSTEVDTQINNNENNDNSRSTPRAAARSPDSFGPEQSTLETIPEAYPPGPLLDNFFRGFDYELFDLSSLIVLPETHGSTHGMLPTSREEAENGSLPPLESAFVSFV